MRPIGCKIVAYIKRKRVKDGRVQKINVGVYT